jgi:hypothetical protein
MNKNDNARTEAVRIRGFAAGARIFEEEVAACDRADIEALVDRHVALLAGYPRYMLEIEFLDEPDPRQRFFRFGTDPSCMVAPVLWKGPCSCARLPLPARARR